MGARGTVQRARGCPARAFDRVSDSRQGATLMIALTLALALTGTALLVGWGPLRRQPAAEKVVLALAFSVIALAVVSLVLARLRVYSPLIASAGLVSLGGGA